MSLEKGLEWSFGNHDFRGYSIAGQTTSIVYKNAKICFDIAQGLPFHMNSKLFCLSHLHADHGAGLNYILSQRSLFRLPQANIMLPATNIKNVEVILRQWMEIEGFEYNYNLIGVEHNTTFDLTPQLQVRAFSTTHRVDSFGYILYSKKKRLKPQYQGLPREEILKLKAQQQEIEEDSLHPIVCYTGDTQIEFLDAHPDVRKADVLFMETTYLDDKKSIPETRKWGHTHLNELLPELSDMKNKKICLIHVSARYSMQQVRSIVAGKIPSEHKDRVDIFPRPF